jgi:hypothetical protein
MLDTLVVLTKWWEEKFITQNRLPKKQTVPIPGKTIPVDLDQTVSYNAN